MGEERESPRGVDPAVYSEMKAELSRARGWVALLCLAVLFWCGFCLVQTCRHAALESTLQDVLRRNDEAGQRVLDQWRTLELQLNTCSKERGDSQAQLSGCRLKEEMNFCRPLHGGER